MLSFFRAAGMVSCDNGGYSFGLRFSKKLLRLCQRFSIRFSNDSKIIILIFFP